LMLREGRVIFSGTNEEFVQSPDPYIQKFISGTEIEPNRVEQRNQ
jgi:ABC-type transporter Mla maintaining outer membrane lipid asymmetry ATPase subunit MlaF